MRKILITIKQKWANAILDGRKTVELRKTRPAGQADEHGYLHAQDVAYIVSTPGKQVIGKCIVNLYTHCEGKLDDYAPQSWQYITAMAAGTLEKKGGLHE